MACEARRVRRVHARARPRAELQREHVLQRLRPGSRAWAASSACGNRANEGYAEMTVCLYLPDGRVGFMFKRAEIADNDAFDAGGITLRRGRAVRASSTCRYAGKVVMLDDPLADGRPEEGLHREPVRRVRGRTSTYTGQGRPTCSAASPTSRTRSPARSSPRATTSSSSPARARSASATRSGRSTGFGLRDHSWGPRYWQAPWYYRWLTANFGPDFGFMAQPGRPARRRRHPGRLRLGGRHSSTSATTSSSRPSGRATTATTRRSRRTLRSSRRARSGRSPAR